MDTQSIPLAVALSIAMLISGGSYARDDEVDSSRQLVEQGFDSRLFQRPT
jgi:hypothetical protein